MNKNLHVALEKFANLELADLHVHFGGIISPLTAWQLGIKNQLIRVAERGGVFQVDNCKLLPKGDPNKGYLSIFKKGFAIGEGKKPINLEYACFRGNFHKFDQIMATIQGHRHGWGALQDEDDVRYVFARYLISVKKDNISYSEMQINLRISLLLYPVLSSAAALQKFALLLKEISIDFLKNGVSLRFIQCFNHSYSKGIESRAEEALQNLIEARSFAPDIFVGLESAGKEELCSTSYDTLFNIYRKAYKLGFGCEMHAGEQAGSGYMKRVMQMPLHRVAHGVQMIECNDLIKEVNSKDVSIVMMPHINVHLSLSISRNGEPTTVSSLERHPILKLFRENRVKICIASDNPELGGLSVRRAFKDMIKMREGISLEEVAILCLNSARSCFDKKWGQAYEQRICKWISCCDLDQDYIFSFYSAEDMQMDQLL